MFIVPFHHSFCSFDRHTGTSMHVWMKPSILPVVVNERWRSDSSSSSSPSSCTVYCRYQCFFWELVRRRDLLYLIHLMVINEWSNLPSKTPHTSHTPKKRQPTMDDIQTDVHVKIMRTWRRQIEVSPTKRYAARSTLCSTRDRCARDLQITANTTTIDRSIHRSIHTHIYITIVYTTTVVVTNARIVKQSLFRTTWWRSYSLLLHSGWYNKNTMYFSS